MRPDQTVLYSAGKPIDRFRASSSALQFRLEQSMTFKIVNSIHS